jgi:predicted RNA-binding Zn ribbon-like protein
MTARRSGEYALPAAIPHTLSAYPCVDFVNSRFTDHTGSGQVYDRLELEQWRRWFSHRCGLALEGAITPAVLRRSMDLRDVLRGLLLSHRFPTNGTIHELNAILSPAQAWRMSRNAKGVECHLTWVREDWRAVMATAVASYAQLLVNGAIDRISTCSNPHCTFLFYDESRNRSRRWCEATTCGNLVKVRRHRAHRQLDASAKPRNRVR